MEYDYVSSGDKLFIQDSAFGVKTFLSYSQFYHRGFSIENISNILTKSYLYKNNDLILL